MSYVHLTCITLLMCDSKNLQSIHHVFTPFCLCFSLIVCTICWVISTLIFAGNLPFYRFQVSAAIIVQLKCFSSRMLNSINSEIDNLIKQILSFSNFNPGVNIFWQKEQYMLSIRCNDCDKGVNPTKESGSTGMVVDHPTQLIYIWILEIQKT